MNFRSYWIRTNVSGVNCVLDHYTKEPKPMQDSNLRLSSMICDHCEYEGEFLQRPVMVSPEINIVSSQVIITWMSN